MTVKQQYAALINSILVKHYSAPRWRKCACGAAWPPKENVFSVWHRAHVSDMVAAAMVAFIGGMFSPGRAKQEVLK